MHSLRTKMVAILLVLSAAVYGLAAIAADSPNKLVEDAIAELAKALDGRKDELAADRKALHALIDNMLLPRFDRTYAAQLVLGQHWRTASPKQRERFINAFYNALVRKYADGVLEFEQDKIEVLPFRGDATKQRTMVKTIVKLNDGSKVPVNYGLVMRDSGWLIFDVTIEGISYIRNYRAELDSEIRGTSLDDVIQRFESEAGIVAGK